MYMCMWGCLDKYIRVATWPPKQKFLAPLLGSYTWHVILKGCDVLLYIYIYIRNFINISINFPKDNK